MSANAQVDSIIVNPGVSVDYSNGVTVSSNNLLDDGSIIVEGGAALITTGGTTYNGIKGGGNLGTGPGQSGSIDVTGPGSSYTVTSYLNIGQLGMVSGGMQTGGTGHLTVENGATLTVGGQDGDYTAVSNGSSLAVESGATMTVDDLNLAGGTFELKDATLNATGDATDGGAAGPSAVYVNNAATVDNGTINAQGNIVVGNGNAAGTVVGHVGGILNISNNSQITAEALVIGATYGDEGRVTIDGAGTVFDVDAQGAVGNRSGALTVGDGGVGNLTVSDGAALQVSANAGIAVQSTGSGIMFVQGQGSTVDIAQVLQVGIEGNGALQISDGGTVTANLLFVGSLLDEDNNINGHGTITITGDDSSLTVADGGTYIGYEGFGEVAVEDGGTLTAGDGEFILGEDMGSQGTLSIDGAGSTLDYDGDIVVGRGGEGNLIFGNEALYEAAGNITAGSEDGGEGTIDVHDDGTLLGIDGDLTLGEAGTGNLTLTDSGALFVVGSLEEGIQEGSSGTDNIEGADTTFDIQTNWTIGVAGAHDDTISGVEHANVAGDLVIGEEDGSDGSLTLTGEDTNLAVTGDIKIGEGGTGSLSVEDGTTFDLSDKDLTLGEEETGSGTLSISGDGSTVELQSLTVGGEGTGDVELSDGGTLDVSGDITIGESDGSTGTINADTEFSANDMTVGAEATGTLIVTDSTTINGDLVVGESAGSTGTVTVNGGTLEMDSSVKIGAEGSGTLRVQLGGTATAEETTLGESNGSSGEIDVDGDNSSLQVTSLTIGSAGAATVSITNGGRLVATDDVTVADQVSSNIDTMTVDSGGSFGIDRDLTIGGSAIAQANVMNGSTLTADGDVVLGDTSSGDGTLIISGTGFDSDIDADRPSSLGYGGTLTVGNQGSGTLGVFDGALVGPVAGGSGAIEIGAEAGSTGYIYVGDAGTVLNAGAVSIGGTEIDAGGRGTLTVENDGAAIVGEVKVWGDGTLALSAGGTISATDYTVASGGLIMGAGEIAGEIVNSGTLTATGGTLVVDNAITNNGAIGASDGRLTLEGTVSATSGHSGEVTISAGGTVEFVDAVAADQTVDFESTAAELQIDQVASFAATVDSFFHGDVINLHAVNYAASDTATLGADNILHVATASGTTIIDIQLDPDFNYSDAIFSLAKDSNGGMDIETSAVACYCPGTLILTPNGDVAVEQLAIGDLVVTASGDHRPIKWIGRRSYQDRFIMGRADLLPICFTAGSLGENLPRRDLWISPHHAMYFADGPGAGVLIEAKDLVNGSTIYQATEVGQIHYVHVELGSHDVLVAEGAPSETFVDDNSRGMFQNAHTFQERYPDDDRVDAVYCAPRVDDGYAFESVRERIAARAGIVVQTAQVLGELRGNIDRCELDGDEIIVEGWAQDMSYPDVPVCLDVFTDGRVVGITFANQYRCDLDEAGIGDGHHAFRAQIAGMVGATMIIGIRRSADGQLLGRTVVNFRNDVSIYGANTVCPECRHATLGRTA